MAKLHLEGITEIEKQLTELQKDFANDISSRVLKAGAWELVNGWKKTIRDNHHVSRKDKEHMVDVVDWEISIKPDGSSATVYPRGTDSHRITHAQKAFILHYGRKPTKKGTKGITGDKFVTKAEKEATPKIVEAMQRALDRAVAEKKG